MKLVIVLVLIVIANIYGLVIADDDVGVIFDDEIKLEETDRSNPTDSGEQEDRRIIEALKHLTEDFKITKSKLEKKLELTTESLNKTKRDLEHVIVLEPILDEVIKRLSEKIEADHCAPGRKKKKYILLNIFDDTDYVPIKWDSADILCRSKGFELASIENEAEQKELEMLIKCAESSGFPNNVPDRVWIGAHKIKEKAIWRSSGKPLLYANWKYDVGEHETINYECVELLVSVDDKSKKYKWGWTHCGKHLDFYACEYFV